MTGTTVISNTPSEIKHKDNIFYQLSWTGNPVGTFAVQVSADYNPGLPQTDGALNNGTWTTVPAVDQSGNPGAASGSAGVLLYDLQEISAPFIRVQYTNSSGTGALTGYVFGKSLGV